MQTTCCNDHNLKVCTYIHRRKDHWEQCSLFQEHPVQSYTFTPGSCPVKQIWSVQWAAPLKSLGVQSTSWMGKCYSFTFHVYIYLPVWRQTRRPLVTLNLYVATVNWVTQIKPSIVAYINTYWDTVSGTSVETDTVKISRFRFLN